jgi:hypothetical protein
MLNLKLVIDGEYYQLGQTGDNMNITAFWDVQIVPMCWSNVGSGFRPGAQLPNTRNQAETNPICVVTVAGKFIMKYTILKRSTDYEQ